MDSAHKSLATTPNMSDRRSEYALVLHGLVGTLEQAPSAALWLNLRGSGRLLHFTAASHLEYIVRANARAGVDVFAHSWNPELSGVVATLYGTHLLGSRHDPPVFADKARSQALSLGRAAELVLARERARGYPYALTFALRWDAFVGAPVALARLRRGHITISESCCVRDAVSPSEKALVLGRCGEGACNATTGACTNYRKGRQYTGRLLGHCTPEIHQHQWQAKPLLPSNPYMFANDWWIAAPPAVIASFGRISEDWRWVLRRLRQLSLPAWSHFVWPLHVHDTLNLTRNVRFEAGVRIGLTRKVFERIRTGCRRDPLGGPCHKSKPLGHYYADPVGFCDVLQPYNSTGEAERVLRADRVTGESFSASALLSKPLAPDASGVYLGYFEPRFEAMASQCPFARLPEPIVCCGKWAHLCGIRRCPFEPDYTRQNQKFSRRAFHARKGNASELVRLVRCGRDDGARPRELKSC